MFCRKQTMIYFFLAVILVTTGCVPNNFTFQKELGKSGSGTAEFLSPTDLDLDKNGNLVVADAGNTRFQIISTSGSVVSTGGEFGLEGMRLQSISGIGVDKGNDVIWVCDQKGNKLVQFDSAGTAMRRVTKNMKYPMDVAVDSNHELYVIMSRKPEIYKYSGDGKFIEKIGGQGQTAFIFPTSIVIDKDIIYVTDFGGKRIVKMNLDGSFIEEIKNKGEYEEMKGPSGLFIDPYGNLYVLDLGEVPVVVLSSDGKLISQVGAFGNKEGSFLYPSGVVAKDQNDIYILDNTRNTIINFSKKSK